VAIVESSIEALSLNALHGYTCVSLGGTSPKRAAEVAREWQAKGATVYAAQNADDAGDKQASKLAKDVREVERLRPPAGKDWNDVLCAMKPEDRLHLEQAAQAAQTVESLTSGLRPGRR
jgi:DNA primase